MRWTHAFMYDRAVAKDRAYDGRFYTAVSTTGIYCLPSCPARKPKAENTRFFPSEEEAKAAGFRACHRCRPDRFQAGGNANLVLLETLIARVHEAPGRFQTVEDLTSESGWGTTRLAELFREHLHLTPLIFLQRVRVREAQRLLVTTSQVVSDVALEAGFESPSVFHALFRKQAALTPGEYRRLAQSDGFVLALPRSYRVEDVLAYHGRDPLSLCERVEGRTLFKAIGECVLEIRFEESRALCLLHGASKDGPARVAMHHCALRMLGLHQDPAAFERSLARHLAFQRLVAARPGLRVPLTANVWEALVWAILGQQVNLAFAYALRRALVARLGQPRTLGLRSHPGPEALAWVNLKELSALRLSRAKAECLLRVAQATVSGALDLETLTDEAATRASARLLALKGIGPWTAQYVLMRGCGFGDCVPIGDAGLTLALQRHFGLDHRPNPTETAHLLAAFAPHRSLAVFHLWASLKGVPA